MQGYSSSSYGDGFADVYDEWYADVTDVDATVRRVSSLAASSSERSTPPTVLELGVGTGRLAIPMAASGLVVTGVDSSAAMLSVLDDRLVDIGEGLPGAVRTLQGDMVDDLPDERFDVVLVAYNTLFNLLDAAAQQSCFAAVAERLTPGGSFLVEAIVPDPDAPRGRDVSVRTMAVDRVVLSVSDHRPDEQRTDGQFIELTEDRGVRLRPWAIRWCDTTELDAMAAAAGLTLTERHADMAGSPFTDGADTHVSRYQRAAATH